MPLMAAVKAAAHPGMPRQVRKLEDSPMRSVRAADFSPMKSSPVVLEAMGGHHGVRSRAPVLTTNHILQFAEKYGKIFSLKILGSEWLCWMGINS